MVGTLLHQAASRPQNLHGEEHHGCNHDLAGFAALVYGSSRIVIPCHSGAIALVLPPLLELLHSGGWWRGPEHGQTPGHR